MVLEKNSKNTNLRLRRSFWYQSELLTPNSFRERSDERWWLRFYVRHTQMLLCLLCNGNTSPLAHFTNGTSIFHRTVLESYLELEARNGTKMTASVSSLCFCCCFPKPQSHFVATFEKPWNIGAKNQFRLSRIQCNRWKKSRNIEIMMTEMIMYFYFVTKMVCTKFGDYRVRNENIWLYVKITTINLVLHTLTRAVLTK